MTDLVDRLALIIDAHTDGAVTSIHRLSLEEQAAAERTDLLKTKITELEARMAATSSGGTAAQTRQLGKLNGEYKALTANLATTSTSTARVEKALGSVGLQGLVPGGLGGSVAKAIPGIAAGVAAYAEFKFLKSGVEEFTNLGAAIRQVQLASGATAVDASKLVGISNALGVSTTAASLGVFRLGKNIALQPQNLTNLGIAIERTRSGEVDLIGTLENVATAYQKTADPAKRAAIVYEAFGRAGTTLLPILAANKKQIEEIVAAEAKRGHIFSQQDIDNAYQYQVATRELKDSFQGLAVAAGKFVVPALTDVAKGLTKVNDAATSSTGSKILNVLKYFPIDPFAPFFYAKKTAGLLGFGGGGGGDSVSAAERAKAEIDQEAQQALVDQSLATLAGATDKLAGPAAIKTAKQTLSDARSSLQDAVNAREAAARDLATAQQGSPGASASQIEAAVARVQAAQERLTAAQYVGGSAVASARSSLLSAQSSLNRLRQQGGVDTNRLADAEDRLRKANKAVADQQKAARQAQHGVNQATGLNADQVLARIRGQVGDRSDLLSAQVKLAGEGASQDLLGELDKLNQSVPGTLVKVADTASRTLVKRLNSHLDQFHALGDAFAAVVGDPTAYDKAGRVAGKAFLGGIESVLHQGLPGFGRDGRRGQDRAGGTRSPRNGLDLLHIPGVHVHGDLNVKGANAREVAREVARKSRLHALSTGDPNDGLGGGI